MSDDDRAGWLMAVIVTLTALALIIGAQIKW